MRYKETSILKKIYRNFSPAKKKQFQNWKAKS